MKLKKFLLPLILVIFVTTPLLASEAKKNDLQKLQAGAWFGPITPIMSTGDVLNTSLGGGAFMRYTLPWLNNNLRVGLDASFQRYTSDSVNKLIYMPVYTSIMYRLPLSFPVKFQFNAGLGGSYLSIEPDRKSQFDPVFVFGSELSFPAGNRVNIGLRVEYQMIFEQYISGAKYNGHVITTGLTLYFNIGQ